MKKQKTIFFQLLVNILLPVFFILLVFSFINYYINKNKLQENYVKEQKQVSNEVKSLLHVYDQSLQIFEEEIDTEITRISTLLKEKYFAQTDSITSADLTRIALEINMDTSDLDIYMINRDGIIENTTYAKDDGLNFYKIDIEFKKFFEKIWAGKKLVIDRFGSEMSTFKIKKYSYNPTYDGKFIIEIGTYSRKANIMNDNVNEQIENLKLNFPEFTDIKSFVAKKDIEHPWVKKEHQQYYQQAIKTKSTVRVTEQEGNKKVFYDYIYIDMPGAVLYSGYILLIQSDDTREKALLWEELLRFAIIMSFTILPLFLLVYFRSRKIIHPIRMLNEKVQVISKGNLDERVPIEGNNEITTLSHSFNKMVEELQESYNTLESKVIERTLELRLQKEIIEEKHKEITDSINYAERIQRSFLATKDVLDENLKDYFVFFKPKDVVSGDFYWASTLVNGDFAYCCADSTGHGVPGAIMSILNISSLEKAIETETSPDKIFYATRKIIIDRLKKDGSPEGGKDGMDGSIMVLNSEKTKLKFASAHNPVVLIRKGEVIEFKGDKIPVGKHDRDKEEFSLQEIDLLKGDIIYILTDGFPDQFGGVKGKKYMIKNLKNYFLNISSLPMKEQENKLAQELENWIGNNEQVDDICIIGVRI